MLYLLIEKFRDGDPVLVYRRFRDRGRQNPDGLVYLADDPKHARKVALKVLKPELAAGVGAERFLAEIKTTANRGVGLSESTTDVTNP